MNANERALQVVNQIDAIVTEEQGYDNLPTPKIAGPIAAAIRAAENEALERAAKVCDEMDAACEAKAQAAVGNLADEYRAEGWAFHKAAKRIRSLKEPTPGT